ncbi:MAG: LTA synthase family protein [Defluviitaleaceae bacterium]|nr:LTA synthase family protein [Defluviitaleaceae bacterium]
MRSFLKNLRIQELLPKRLHLNYWLGLWLTFAAAIVFTYFMFALQPFEPWLLEHVLDQSGWLLLWLNFLPILLASLILYFATNSFTLSSGITGFVVVALSVANRFKQIFRHDPLTTWDFMLGAETAVILRGFSPRLVFGTLAGFTLIIAIIAVAMLFVRTTRMPATVRWPGLALCLSAALMSSRTTFSDIYLFDSLYVYGTPHRLESQFNSRGFLYSFIHIHLTSEITQPDGFNAAHVSERIAIVAQRAALSDEHAHTLALAESTATPDMSRHPHVIMVLAEAFSELAFSPGLTFEGGFHPSYHFKRLREESLHGHIVVPNFGGGTADTEFDILTGISTRLYRGMAYSYMLITREFPSIVSILNGLGFHSQAMHPGYEWFYNRENVFEFLGFDNYMAGDAFEGAPTRGGYVTEEYTFDRLIERFEEHLALRPNVPLFEFVITIQNHGPYDHAKHPNAYTIQFDSDPPLSESDADMLRTYFYGIADVDNQLARLTDFMAATVEPVVIIYFSDHMPLVTRGIVDAHQRPPNALTSRIWPYIGDFTVPFIIWQNDAARELLHGRTPPALLSDTYQPLLSSFMLGALMLEYLGLESSDPFMYFLSGLRKKIPVQLEFAYFDALGNMFSYGDDMDSEVRLYKHWSYYRLFN